MFPLFWVAGALILLSPLRAPEEWALSKTEAEREELKTYLLAQVTKMLADQTQNTAAAELRVTDRTRDELRTYIKKFVYFQSVEAIADDGRVGR